MRKLIVILALLVGSTPAVAHQSGYIEKIVTYYADGFRVTPVGQATFYCDGSIVTVGMVTAETETEYYGCD